MKTYPFQVVLRCFALIGLLPFTGCSSATPEKLQIVNGKLDACLLLTVSEVESVLATKTSTDPFSFDNGTGCRYDWSRTESPALVTYIYTDATFEEAGLEWTVAEWFEIEKKNHVEFAAKISDITVEDVPELGDTAYYEDSSILYLFVLNNGIEYVFTTRTPEDGGKGSLSALIVLAKMALQKMP